MTRWFRFYDAALDDPKVQRLPDAAFRAWVNLLCLAARNDGKISESWEDLSFALRKSIGKTRELLQILISTGLVDITEKGFEPHNWKARQYVSDVSTARVKRFRERAETVSETPPEQIQNRTETETDKKVEAPAKAVAPRSKPIRGTRWQENQAVPPDWITEAAEMRRQASSPTIDLDYEARRFENYWVAKAGGAAALKLDWRRTWLNWATDKEKTGNGRSNKPKSGTSTDQHISGIVDLRDELRARAFGRGT